MTTDWSVRSIGRRPAWATVSLWGAVILAVVVVGRMLDAPILLTRALDGIRGLGAWGLVLFVGLYVVAALARPGSRAATGGRESAA